MKCIGEFINNNYNIIVCICNVVLAGGVIFAGFQFAANLQHSRAEQSVELALYFKDRIMKYVTLYKDLYATIGLTPIVNKLFEGAYLTEFNLNELQQLIKNEIISVSELNRYLGMMEHPNFVKAFVECCKINNIDIESIKNDDIKLKSFCDEMLIDTMNDMEYFSMKIMNNVADRKCLFQVIRLAFMELFELLSIRICIVNKTDYVNKLFTNSIDLYNQWVKETSNEQKKINGENIFLNIFSNIFKKFNEHSKKSRAKNFYNKYRNKL